MVSIGALRYDIIADTQQFQQGIVATRKELSAAKRLFNETRTPAENLGIEIEGLARLHKKGAIDAETHRRAVERVTEAHKREERAIEGSTAEIKQQRLALLSSIPVLGRYTSQVGKISPGMIAAGAGIGIAVSAMYAGVRAAEAFTRSVAEQMKEIDALAKSARKLGASTEGLAGLRLAAEEFSGMAAPQFDTALQRMTRRLAEAAQGTGEAQGAIKELGLDAAALSDKGPEEAFKDIAEAIQGVESPAHKLRIAFKLFDSEGASLVTTLNAGRDAIEGMEAKAKLLGISITDIDAAQIEAANDAITDAKKAMNGLSATVAIQLAPAIEQAAKDMTAFTTNLKDSVGTAMRARVQLAGLIGMMEDLALATQGSQKIMLGNLKGGLDDIREASRMQNAFRSELEAGLSVARSYGASMKEAFSPPIEAGEASPIRKRIEELYDLRRELTQTEAQIEDIKFHRMGANAAQLGELELARQALAERQALVKAREDERKEVERIAKAESDARNRQHNETMKQQAEALNEARKSFEERRKLQAKMRQDVAAGPGDGLEANSTEAAKYLADQRNAMIGAAAAPDLATPGEQAIIDEAKRQFAEIQKQTKQNERQTTLLREQLTTAKENGFRRWR